jgi:hypothetical protein
MRLTPRQAARLESLEAELDAAPADHRRVIALKATGVMFAASGVTPLERDAAAARVIAQLPSGWAKQPELAETVADLLAERLLRIPVAPLSVTPSQSSWRSSAMGYRGSRRNSSGRSPIRPTRTRRRTSSGWPRSHILSPVSESRKDVYNMCMSFGRRFQLLLDDARYERLAAAARERKVSVAVVIRDAIDLAVPADLERKRAAAAEILAVEPIAVPDVAELRQEIAEGRSGAP